jgi:hypothetical protein
MVETSAAAAMSNERPVDGSDGVSTRAKREPNDRETARAPSVSSSSSARPSPRELFFDVVAVAGIHAAACVIARVAGFDHVSDDDFARVTIAQSFAHTPKLDPSGTSWLPFPFWILGGLMMVVGRSLASARVLSIALSSLGAAAPLVALRVAGVGRLAALGATAFAFGTPWAIWLGAATVPESFCASLTAAAVIGLGSISAARPRSALLFALAIALASLSRYEPWPVAGVLAIALAVRAIRWSGGKSMRPIWGSAAVVCALGPVLWMLWNAHAHDGPLHFFRRVSSFKRAIGEGATDTLSALALYPRLLFITRPEVAIPALGFLPALWVDGSLRRRWALPLLAVAAQIAFLACGNARDGAPAHHPERALLGAMVVLALFVGDALIQAQSRAFFGKAIAPKLLGAALVISWLASFAHGAEIPGRTPSEDRDVQLARGARLREEGRRTIVLTPCAFEHFAWLAAYGAPEDVELKPRSNLPVTSECPLVAQPDR